MDDLGIPPNYWNLHMPPWYPAIPVAKSSKAKAWLVCCLRPNDVGQADRVRLGDWTTVKNWYPGLESVREL